MSRRMRIDDDSFSKQVQQHQHLQQNSSKSWRTPVPAPTPAPDFQKQKRDSAGARRHNTAGRILIAREYFTEPVSMPITEKINRR